MRPWTEKHIEELISKVFDKKIQPYADAIQILFDTIGSQQTTINEGGNQDETEQQTL